MKRRKKQSYRSANSNFSHRTISNSTRVKLFEALEARRLLSAGNTITGTVFNDVNHNGIQDPGEVGVAGITVYEDPNYNHKLDANEQSAVTDLDGDFTFTNLPADPEILRVILPSGATQTFPANGIGDYVGKNTGQNITGENFGINLAAAAKATVSGSVYVDSDNNGVHDPADTGVAGVNVYVDLNSTGAFVTGDPSAVTDANGNYTIANVPSGLFTVREVVPADRMQVNPIFNEGITINFAGTPVTNQNFQVTALPPSGRSISGTVFDDLNHNGVQDPGEPGLAGVTVYQDPNYNHKLDAGEQSVVTDAAGNYTFPNPPADPEILRVALSGGAQQTFPGNGIGIYVGTDNSGQPLINRDFGVYESATGAITGNVFDDLNGDHVQDGGEPNSAGTVVYLDLNHNGKFDAGEPTATADFRGDFTFTGLAAGKYTVNLIPDNTFHQSAPVTGGLNVTVTTGNTTAAGSLGETNSAYVGGTLFNDLNGNGVQDAGEPALAGWKVYIDSANDGVYQSGDPIAQTTTTSTGYWYFRALGPGTYTISAVAPSGWTITHAFTITVNYSDMIINGSIGAKQV